MGKRPDDKRRGSSFGFPEGQPPSGPNNLNTFPFDSKRPSNQRPLIEKLLLVIGDLGPAVEKTVLFHLKQKGINLTDPSLAQVDLVHVRTILVELVGPGADFIMEEALKHIRVEMRKEAGKQ